MASITWLRYPLCLITGSLFIRDMPFVPGRPWRYQTAAAYLLIYGLLMFWTFRVREVVPEPYLDEVFHIPQAQAYCDGRYDVWDPKLTTPPGLYIFSTLFTKLWWGGACGVFNLRTFNTVTLLMTMTYALDCRLIITKLWKRESPSSISSWLKDYKPISSDALHTAFNIALFPPLFFFSGLFYTDVLSTCLVLRSYRLFLQRNGAYKNSAEGLVWVYIAGIISLTMRQTNIFWVAVFMAGLEAVRTLKSNESGKLGQQYTFDKKTVSSEFKRYSHGYIHDVPLKDAGVHDFSLSALSILIATLYHPILILTRLWPYIGLLLSFASFVAWNGGVVLGDKTNHVATIHLPQLLYLTAFTAFSSFPLMLTPTLTFLGSTYSLISLPLFPRLKFKYFLIGIYCTAALGTTLIVIKYNTIIHPFTLADNRHYVFYIFRYSILRHPLIRYSLGPIYLICGYLAYLTLCPQLITPTPQSQTASQERKTPKEIIKERRERESRARVVKEQPEGPTTSFLLIFVLSTALSLITAPLVEPRYFIIPWVIWRLHVPPLPSSPTSSQTSASTGQGQKNANGGRWMEVLKSYLFQGHDYRLWLETACFLLIDLITGYIFLYRGFSWPQEPGKVQRFMW